MSRVECATESWGVVTDQAGNVRTSLPVSITLLADGSTAVLYDAITGGNPIANPQTDGNGAIPGFIEQGSYVVSVGGVTHNVQALTATVPQSAVANQPATSVCVTGSTLVAPSNPSRIELLITNDDATNVIYLALGTDAVVNAGIRLNPNGGSYKTNVYTGIVSANCAATAYVDVAEV